MTAFYNIHTDATYAFSMNQLGSIWRWACTGSASGVCASQAIRFNKPPLGFTFIANQAPVVVTAGNTHLVDAACKVLNGVNGGGACMNQLDSRYLQFRDIGIQHGIDY